MKTFSANCSPVRGELRANSRELGRIRQEFGERLANVRRTLAEFARKKSWRTVGELARSSPQTGGQFAERDKVFAKKVFKYSAKNVRRERLGLGFDTRSVSLCAREARAAAVGRQKGTQENGNLPKSAGTRIFGSLRHHDVIMMS